MQDQPAMTAVLLAPTAQVQIAHSVTDVATGLHAKIAQPALTAMTAQAARPVTSALAANARIAQPMVAATGLLVKSQLATVPTHLVKIGHLVATLTTHVAQIAPIV
jgi:hypothetical protein